MNNDIIIKAVGYCRFSSDHQKELSIEAQKRAILAYCEKNNYYIDDWFVDRAYSGQTDNRPDFQRLIKTIESGNYDFTAVIVHKLDRFSRNIVDSFQYQQFFSDNNIELISTEENFSGDDFMFGINALLNQRYVRNLSKEVMKGMKERAYKSMFNGGKPPLGYDIINGEYIINEAEAVIVREIFEMAAKGYGYNTIIKELNAKGYKTKRGNPFGKNFIYDLMRNERYKGTYLFNQTAKRNSKRKRNMHKYKDESEVIRIENAIPAIVSKDLWERANASRKLTAKTSTNAKYDYLLSGLVYCGECGAKFHGTHRRGGGKPYNVYRCNKQSNQLKCGCREIKAEFLESFVIDSLTKHFFNSGIVEIITEQVNNKISEMLNADNEQAVNAKNALSGLKTVRSNLVETLAETGYNKVITDKLEDVERQISEYQAIIEAEQSKRKEIRITTAEVENKIKELKSYMKNPDNTDRTKLLLRSYIERIDVDNKTVKVTFKVAFSFCLKGEEQTVFYTHTAKEYRLLIEKRIKPSVGKLPKQTEHRNFCPDRNKKNSQAI